MIPNHVVTNIMETAQIEEVVSDFVSLKKRGANYVACCPFHNEKTPSFSVSPSKGIFKCFGCGQAGNPVKFVMEIENMSYPDALRFLGQKYKIDLEEVNDEEGRAEQQEKESLFIANQFALAHFKENLLQSDEGKSVGLSYFRQRGFNEATIEKFQLGYSMDDFETFLKVAKAKGYKVELLKKLGLVSEKNGRTFPFFRGRVMFPIHSLSGKVIAFAGRTLKKDKKSPKYVNSPETDIYFKSKILYGMNLARNPIRQQDECYLVEGYTDVISMHQAGIENIVASSGTSLTIDQVKLIKRYTQNVTLLFDGDAAGIKAALRGVDIILTEGMNVKVVILPDGEDPDSYVKENGRSGFKEYVEQNIKDFIFFKTDLLLKDADTDPVKRAGIIKEVIETLAKIPDPIRRSLYIRECARLLEISERLIITETNKIKFSWLKKQQEKRERKEEGNQRPSTITIDSIQQAERAAELEKLEPVEDLAFCERELVRSLLEYGDQFLEVDHYVSVFIIEEIAELPLSNPQYQKIVDIYIGHLEEGKMLGKEFFMEYDTNDISATTINLLVSPYEVSENWEELHQIFVTAKIKTFKKEVTQVVNLYKLRRVMSLMEETDGKIKEINKTGSVEDLEQLLKVKIKLLQWKSQLAENCNYQLGLTDFKS